MYTFPKDEILNCDISKVCKIDKKEIHPLFHCSYWDGPYNGMCVFNNEKFWFHCIEENECPSNIDEEDLDDWFDSQTWWRRYALIQLSKEQIETELYWHILFEMHVGTHTNYKEGWRRANGTVRDSSNHDKFYSEQSKNRKGRDFRENEVIGWFEL